MNLHCFDGLVVVSVDLCSQLALTIDNTGYIQYTFEYMMHVLIKDTINGLLLSNRFYPIYTKREN